MNISTKDSNIRIYQQNYKGDEITTTRKKISSLGTIGTFLRTGT